MTNRSWPEMTHAERRAAVEREMQQRPRPTCKQIGEKLGAPGPGSVSRWISVHAPELSYGRHRRVRPTTRQRPRWRGKGAPGSAPTPLPRHVPIASEPGEGMVTFSGLRDDLCHWPTWRGDYVHEVSRYCGAPALVGTTYCRGHQVTTQGSLNAVRRRRE